jgi:hypothetical protein
MVAALTATVSMAGQKGPQFKHYQDENDKEQAALEGKSPPPIVATEWVNSKPLNWRMLKGNVVLIDLWAYW